MKRGSFDQPQRLKLRKHEEKQIVQLLSRLPEREPAIEIGHHEGEAFTVAYGERLDCFVPLRVGAEGFYVDYDASTGARMETSFLRVPRLTRAHRVRQVQYDDIGGDDLQGGQGFHLIWYWDKHYTPSAAEPWRTRDLLDGGGIVARRLAADDGVRWLDAETAEGPAEGETLFAGYHTLSIGGRRFDCMRVLCVWRDKGRPAESNAGWDRLDNRYLSREGRTVLLRRYRTEADYRREYARNVKHDPDTLDWPAWCEGRGRLTYNGIEYRHWFDILTDASFRLTWERIGW